MFTNLSKDLCLCLLSVLLISYSSAQPYGHLVWDEIAGKDNMCSIGEKDIVIGVFMLSGDTFFQIRKPNYNTSIYRMNSTRLIKQPYKLFKPWKSAIRTLEIENAIRLSLIDLNENIYAFDYQFDYQDFMKLNICDSQDVTNECQKHWMGQHSFVCLYGYRLQNTERETRVMTYDLDQLRNLSNPTLEAEVKKFCQNQIDYLYENQGCDRGDPMTGWSQITNKSLNDLTLKQYLVCRKATEADRLIRLEFPLKNSNKIGLNYTDYEANNVPNYPDNTGYPGDWWRRTYYIVPITFYKESTGGGDLVIYNCGGRLKSPQDEFIYECTTRTLLTSEASSWWQLPPHPIDGHTIELNDKTITGMTINKLLRCPHQLEYQRIIFEPNHFCKQKSFISIFNLRFEVYFQANSKFWRKDQLIDGRFTNDFMPTVRYDSYTTSLLHKYFRLDLIIFGLTLSIPEGCDFYGEETPLGYKNCWFLPEYQHRLYITCIFGYDKSSSFKAHPFIITHAGIKVYPKDNPNHYNDAKRICDTIGSKGISNGDVMPIGVIDDWKPYWVENARGSEIIIHYLRFYNRRQISQNNYKIEAQVMKLIISMKDKPNSPIVESDYIDINKKESELIEGGVFTDDYTASDRRTYYFYMRNPDLTINTSIILYPGRIYYDGRDFDFDKWVNRTVLQLYYCLNWKRHSYMRYSLVPIKDTSKLLCEFQYPDDSNITFSVFNIGEYVYFQIERQFFRYVPKKDLDFKEGLYYDKQVSELLNDIFDTSERVVGFSFFMGENLDDGKYRVIVMGYTKWFFRKIFDAFVFNYVFEKYKGYFEPLLTILEDDWMSRETVGYNNHMLNPVCAVRHYCTFSKPFQKCDPPIVMRKLAENPTPVKTLDAMGYLDSNKSIISEIDPKPTNDNSTFPSFWAAVINTEEYYSTRHGGHLFYDQLYLPIQERADVGETPFLKVYGMYSMYEVLYVVAVQKYECCKIKIFQISDSTNVKDFGKVMDPHWEYIKNKKYDNGSIDQVFKCEKPTKSSGNPIDSKSSTAMVLIFICLIIVLVILLIIVGFMAYKRFESNKQNSKDVKQKTSKNQSKNEDKKDVKSSSESSKSSKTLRNEDINSVS